MRPTPSAPPFQTVSTGLSIHLTTDVCQPRTNQNEFFLRDVIFLLGNDFFWVALKQPVTGQAFATYSYYYTFAVLSIYGDLPGIKTGWVTGKGGRVRLVGKEVFWVGDGSFSVRMELFQGFGQRVEDSRYPRN